MATVQRLETAGITSECGGRLWSPDSFVIGGTDDALHLRQPQTTAQVACVTRQHIRLCQQTVTHMTVSCGNSKGFEVKVGMHQGSGLSPLLFVIVMENSGLPCHGNCCMLMTWQ